MAPPEEVAEVFATRPICTAFTVTPPVVVTPPCPACAVVNGCTTIVCATLLVVDPLLALWAVEKPVADQQSSIGVHPTLVQASSVGVPLTPWRTMSTPSGGCACRA